MTLDWGINAALLFGRQKAKTITRRRAISHRLSLFWRRHRMCLSRYHTAIKHSLAQCHRAECRWLCAASRSNIPNAKISIGYRDDIFLGAMDSGIDARRKRNRRLQWSLRLHQHRAGGLGRHFPLPLREGANVLSVSVANAKNIRGRGASRNQPLPRVPRNKSGVHAPSRKGRGKHQ